MIEADNQIVSRHAPVKRGCRANNNFTGQRYGKLLVIHEAGRINGGVAWFCRCDCGEATTVRGTRLTAGKVNSCGCMKNRPRHAMNRSRVYSIWRGMKTRCFNKNHRAFQDYGGRGIQVCERWRTFENFFADMGNPADGLTLDRINNDGNYEPGNCRWATWAEQANNRRKARHSRHVC